MILLNPFAPHLSDECWEQLGHQTLLTEAANRTSASVRTEHAQLRASTDNSESNHIVWPSYDPTKIQEETVQLRVMVNGKFKTVLTLNTEEEEELSTLFYDQEGVNKEATSTMKENNEEERGLQLKKRILQDLNLNEQDIQKEIYVRGKVFSLLTKNAKQKNKKKQQ